MTKSKSKGTKKKTEQSSHNSHETASDAKNSDKSTHEAWKEHQHKYAQTAKQMFEKLSTHIKAVKPEPAAVMQSHKKNLEALSDANKMAAEVMKSIASLQSQFVKKTFEDMNMLMHDFMKQKPGQAADLTAHSEVMKNSIQRSMDHAKSLGSVLSDSGKQIHARMSGRMDEAKEEYKGHASKYSKH